jgi:hypothetical protein
MRTFRVLCAVAIASASACAARTAVTTWGWSSWVREGGGGEMGAFDAQRRQCLEQVGVTDPARVQPDSVTEDQFLQCMNGAGWCTTAFGCRKPGA